jgi:hypothetical protein
MKVLHALLAGCLAWACFAIASESERIGLLANAAGAGVCCVWFLVAVGLFFKNRWRWYPRAANIVKILLKVLNGLDDDPVFLARYPSGLSEQGDAAQSSIRFDGTSRTATARLNLPRFCW